MKTSRAWCAGIVALGMQCNPCPAEQIGWANWQAATVGPPFSASGAFADGVGLRATGPIEFVQLGFNNFVGTLPFGDSRARFTGYWTEGTPLPYTGNTLVSNAPPQFELVALSDAGTTTVTFTKPVIRPLMALLSLGTTQTPVTYTFDKPFSVLSSGQGFWGRGTFTLAGNSITGREFHGLIQFQDVVTSVTWTSSTQENWHGFTFGLACYAPDSERSSFLSWDAAEPTAANWVANLNSAAGFSFAGRTVRENDAGFGVDSCWFSGSALPPQRDVPVTTAVVDAADRYIDEVGWTPGPVAYYRAQGRAPCGFSSRQQLQMQCPNGSFKDWGALNILEGNIRSTSVTSSRGGNQASRRWP